jgi:pyruvate dehydrogenase E2 component (dihydrolipoamide acetyltransferase)
MLLALQTMAHGTIASWEKKEGDALNPGDVIAKVETDKATVDFECQDSGFLARILVPGASADVPVGKVVAIMVDTPEAAAAIKAVSIEDLLARIGGAGGKAAAPAPAPAAAPSPAPAAPAPVAAPAPAPVSAPSTAAAASGGRVVASPYAKKVSSIPCPMSAREPLAGAQNAHSSAAPLVASLCPFLVRRSPPLQVCR